MLVLPVLEYASEVWDPYSSVQRQRLEMVHRRAARFCCNDYRRYSSVTDMMTKLGWETLEQRRKKIRLTMMFKITRGLVGVDSTTYLMPAHDQRTRGSNTQKFQRTYTRLNVHKQSFFSRTVAEWNDLKDAAVTAPSIEAFKQQL